MRRFGMASLTALALIALSNDDASAGSVHVGVSKAEVQAARVRLYEHEMHVRAEDPKAFDQKYHLLGKVLASEQGYNEFLKEHMFSKLLCVHTPFLWRVVDGDILYHKIHPFGPRATGSRQFARPATGRPAVGRWFQQRHPRPGPRRPRRPDPSRTPPFLSLLPGS